jgi:hypothetical protein
MGEKGEAILGKSFTERFRHPKQRIAGGSSD